MSFNADGSQRTRKRRLAVLTSGGDSAGMNAAVSRVVRMGITRGCDVFVVREGWQGLVNGNEEQEVVEDGEAAQVQQSDRQQPLGNNTPLAGTSTNGRKRKDSTGQGFVATYGDGELLREGESEAEFKGRYIIRVGWDDVRGFVSEGGTLIGTARCAAFREIEGRRKAVHNLIKHGIDALVVCGGDGSLTGADRLRSEWPEHLDALLKEGKITQELADRHKHLNIVGLVGSIDNDLAGTDLTIGAATALHRICEAVDSISSTASSHSRAFVIEVMGRHCGWLAVMAAIATGADHIFIPERPPKVDDWKTQMCDILKEHRTMGKRKSIVIVAEGALDKELRPITADGIKDVLTERLGLDTRVTTLGHTQRGGKPCAYDRILASLQGCEAVETLLSATPETPSYIIGLSENAITRINMMEAVARTKEVAARIERQDFEGAVKLRDPEFDECLSAFYATTRVDDRYKLPKEKWLRVGIVHVGAPAGGMNTATRTAARYCLSRGHTPLAIYNGWPGLLEDNVSELSWLRVDQWTTRGGSELGTNRKQPEIDLEGIAWKLEEHRIDALMIIGGYEAFTSLMTLEKGRESYRKLRIPMIHLPATISNNVPVTDWSLGSDTSINVLVEACDAIKQSASASRNRVFLIETQGGECGYIAVVGALATGAVIVYSPETGINLSMLESDVDWLKKRYQADVRGKSEGRLIIRSEKASTCYTTEVVTKILSEEGNKTFDARSVQLGHTLQGGTPSPRDRTRAARLAVRCISFLEEHAVPGKVPAKRVDGESGPDTIGHIVLTGASVKIVGLKDMIAGADLKKRRPKNPWWLPLKGMVELMSGKGAFTHVPPQKSGIIPQMKPETVNDLSD